ncbi:hypothetical protein [Pedobacter frigiditerrae]|uniref:hypothetical protein n=1 Tax=Pedobacter frigiditerrae TaxID=2530452 RepID=UPI00292D53F2|nr:hypothetical protein [Pedobacter frigiditerrae]
MDEIEFDNLTEIEDLRCVLNLQAKAQKYLENFEWCKSVKNSWCDKAFSIYDKIGVFLFEIEPKTNEVDDFVWIVVGDLPSVYLDKSIKSGSECLETYCDLMQDWVDNVMKKRSLAESYPIPVEPTMKNAELLMTRISFIREELLTSE